MTRFAWLAVHLFVLLSQVSGGSASAIQWRACKQHGSRPVTCGSLAVPRDYSESTSNQTIELQLVRVNATKQPSRGSILLNPGGPGEDGLSFINGVLAEPLLLATGEEYDLIGFGTRGVGSTLPISCYTNETYRILAELQLPSTTNASDTALGATWASKQALAANCLQNAKDVSELVGTAFVARDMMQIVDALGEDGMLRYWGFSYGTALGATAAAMFPNNVDKMVLDGVLNPTQYYDGKDIQQLIDSDACFAGFFSGCLSAGQERCALAKANVSSESLEQQIIDLLDKLKFYPLPGPPDSLTSIIDYGTVKSAIWTALYTTSAWPALAEALNDLLMGSSTSILLFSAYYGGTPYPNFIEANAAIRCGDSSFRAQKLEEVTPLVNAMYQESFILGDDQAEVPLTCAAWRIRAKEVYTGGFTNIKTKNPLLFVGSPFDPLTPLVSAQNASAGFVGSAVLQNNGYGHSSLGQPSLCAAESIRAYFVNGTLPSAHTVCEPTVGPFSNKTLAEVYAALKH